MKYLIAICTIGFELSTRCVQANQTVAPLGLANQNGNAADDFLQTFGERSFLFSPSELSWIGPVQISGVSFRVDESELSMSAIIPRVEIRMSTSLRSPASMSTLYANTVGVDELLVYARDAVHISSVGGNSPNLFGIVFPFDQTFNYDPLMAASFSK
jgi:hypothetical protein